MTNAAVINSGAASFVSAGPRKAWLPRIATILYVLSMMKFVSRDPLAGTAGIQGVIEVLLPLLSVTLLAAYCLSNRTHTGVPVSALLFAVFGVLSIVSAFSSFWPVLSLSKSCILLLVIGFAILASDALGVREALRALYYSLVMVAGSCLLATAAIGNYTLLFDDEYSGRRRIAILAIHPSMVADIAALTFLIGRIVKPKPHWSLQVGLVLLNVATGTKISTGMLLVIAIGSLLLSLPRGKARAALIPAALAAVLAAIMIVSLAGIPVGDKVTAFAEPVYGTRMAEEAVSLNGRTDLWRAVGEVVLRKMPMGYGFDGARQELLARVPWAGQSHNGFVELLLTGGVLGAFFALAGWAWSVATCFRATEALRWRLLSIHLYLFGATLGGPTPVTLQFFSLVLMIWCPMLALESIHGRGTEVEA